jgi:hypothetical protein
MIDVMVKNIIIKSLHVLLYIIDLLLYIKYKKPFMLKWSEENLLIDREF